LSLFARGFALRRLPVAAALAGGGCFFGGKQTLFSPNFKRAFIFRGLRRSKAKTRNNGHSSKKKFRMDDMPVNSFFKTLALILESANKIFLFFLTVMPFFLF
jgi:hypothetical protein